jgi:hypothetical protein
MVILIILASCAGILAIIWITINIIRAKNQSNDAELNQILGNGGQRNPNNPHHLRRNQPGGQIRRQPPVIKQTLNEFIINHYMPIIVFG